jgi:hypothetical protein
LESYTRAAIPHEEECERREELDDCRVSVHKKGESYRDKADDLQSSISIMMAGPLLLLSRRA